MVRLKRVFGAAVVTFLLPMLAFPQAPALAGAPVKPMGKDDHLSDVRRELDGEKFALDGREFERRGLPQRRMASSATPAIGSVRQWVAWNRSEGEFYRKDFTLRGVGDNIELWVANDIAFPAGDCRNEVPSSIEISDDQVRYFIHEFDNNMYPKESAVFSRPPDRDGTSPQLAPDENGNGGVYTGAGNRTVALVDNIVDANFSNFPARRTYTTGFASSTINDMVDRNVMTVDSFDWLHRTGANPPDEPSDDLCESLPALPFLYEGTFSHEWQHLAQSYVDPRETTWLDEGLADFAQTLTGYVDPTLGVNDRGAEQHIFCFQGFGTVQTPYNPNPRDCGGPENSLTLWNETDSSDATQADYGIAYSFLQFLYDRYGADIITRLHRDGARQGLASLDEALRAEGIYDRYQVIHDFQTMALVDKIVGDSSAGRMLGVSKSRVTTPGLRSTLNLGNPASYGQPGVAPNGADYVALRGADGQPVSGRDLRSLSFDGGGTLPVLPPGWTVVTDDPDRAGNPVLWSGNESMRDASAIFRATVPTHDPTLRLLAKYGAEPGFDWGYVVVSTDGGATYTAIAGDRTVPTHNGPGLTGDSDGFEPHSFDLSAYAGKSVLVGFRYVSDVSYNEGGLFVDDVTLGGVPVSAGDSLDLFHSQDEIRPTKVDWNLRLIGIDEKRSLARQIEFDNKSSVSLRLEQLKLLATFPKVVAIVAYDEPTEWSLRTALYQLKVNGVLQPGGA
ncbi:peptidase M6 immune inhibitor A [Micromonospora sp. NPDC049102]|uniref:peptidase M6 immune inhibitor A n=1 Tax=Micromonospora sp. NPDC049102 TaxID=3364265 RepID=UPI003712994E